VAWHSQDVQGAPPRHHHRGTGMTQLGKWIKLLPEARVAVGVILLAGTALFSLGAATAQTLNNMTALPNRLEQLEVGADTVSILLDSLSKEVQRHIVQDSLATWRIYCVVQRIADNIIVGPFDCESILGRE
jgi:hypothetical protein